MSLSESAITIGNDAESSILSMIDSDVFSCTQSPEPSQSSEVSFIKHSKRNCKITAVTTWDHAHPAKGDEPVQDNGD
jgi:hypothetical protein